MAVDVIATAAPKVASVEVKPQFKYAVGGILAVIVGFLVAKKVRR